MGIRSSIREKMLQRYLPIPIQAGHVEYSVIATPEDDPAVPSSRLLDIALQAAVAVRSLDFSSLLARTPHLPYYFHVWPGEVYKLLTAIVQVLKPKTVIEIGTFTGLSALALLDQLGADARLTTYDLCPWKDFPKTYLKEEDFMDGRFVQRIGDLADPSTFSQDQEIVRKADIIFVDGPKNVVFEEAFLRNLRSLQFAGTPLIIFDDTRLWNMIRIWRHIEKPKLDLTSFGHWTGTGLIDWTA